MLSNNVSTLKLGGIEYPFKCDLIVLEKVQTLNAATNSMIAATSTMLKEQGVAVQKQAIESNINAFLNK